MIRIRGQALGKMSEEEVQEFILWSKAAQDRTTFDLNIVGHPRCAMLITSNGIGRIAYLLCQTVLMAECFIPNPQATKRQKVESLTAFDDGLTTIAKGMNIGDVYLYVPVAEVSYANQIERHGWQEIEGVRLFKKPTGVTVNGRS